MGNQIVVVFDRESKEIITCIAISGQDCICRKDVDFKIFNGTEPIFTETKNGIVLNDNVFMLNLNSK